MIAGRTLFLAALLAVLAATMPAGAAGLPKDLPIVFGGPFTLTDHEGVTRTDRDYRGKFLLIYFGYTTCPDICPTGLQMISDALDRLGSKARKVQPVFVSIDPARDTPAVLKEYVANFHPAFVGLTGTEQQVRAVARAYRVHRSKVIVKKTDDPNDYLVNHSSIAFLMGPDGSWKTLFPHGTDAAAMVAALKRHVN